jgi:hypothetical protein
MKAHGEIIRYYFKYIYTSFSQPVLNSNTGNSEFMVDGTNGNSNYLLFDNNYNTGYHVYSGGGRPDFTSNIHLKKPTCFTGFTALSYKDNDDNHSGHYYIIYGSFDGVNYTQLINTGLQGASTYTVSFTNTNYYNHYRIYASPRGGYDEDEIDIRDFSFSGTQRDVTKGTEENYDYYIDIPRIKLVKEGTDIYTYKAVKSYKKGQYYGGNN